MKLTTPSAEPERDARNNGCEILVRVSEERVQNIREVVSLFTPEWKYL